MSNVIVERKHLENIADAIRYKADSNETFTPAEMAPAILALEPGESDAITITKNGIYIPPAGIRCFDSVFVYVTEEATEVDVVTGTDPDDGNDYAWYVDDDGYIVAVLLPDYIEITTLPDKTSYSVGDAVDLTGIVVKSYAADDTLVSTVDNVELRPVPVTVTSGLTSITVRWGRPYDSEMLEASFSITVA